MTKPYLCHVDIKVTSVPRARTFYQRVFAWKFRQAGNEWDFFTGGKSRQAVEGAIMKPSRRFPGNVTCYFHVSSMERTMARVKRFGGRIQYPKEKMGPYYFAWVKDPSGNVVGLRSR